MQWREEVAGALEEIPGATVYFIYPAQWPDGTVITYACANDIPGEIADDEVYTTEITVRVDVWDKDPLTVWDITEQVKQAMRGIGYRREFCADLYEETGYHHTTMRYITMKG